MSSITCQICDKSKTPEENLNEYWSCPNCGLFLCNDCIINLGIASSPLLDYIRGDYPSHKCSYCTQDMNRLGTKKPKDKAINQLEEINKKFKEIIKQLEDKISDMNNQQAIRDINHNITCVFLDEIRKILNLVCDKELSKKMQIKIMKENINNQYHLWLNNDENLRILDDSIFDTESPFIN